MKSISFYKSFFYTKKVYFFFVFSWHLRYMYILSFAVYNYSNPIKYKYFGSIKFSLAFFTVCVPSISFDEILCHSFNLVLNITPLVKTITFFCIFSFSFGGQRAGVLSIWLAFFLFRMRLLMKNLFLFQKYTNNSNALSLPFTNVTQPQHGKFLFSSTTRR